jgi:glutamate-1-semialdehyde 2,1-aminomutase
MVVKTLNQKKERCQSMRTLLLQETIQRGILMTSLVVSYTHSDEDVDRTLEALDGALAVYKQALEHGVEKFLVGAPSQAVYRKFNFPDQLASHHK